jgi:hypothetical protein
MTESADQKEIVRRVDHYFRTKWRGLCVPLRRYKRAPLGYAPFIAIRNEGQRSKVGHMQAKLSGLSKGFPDMHLLIARGGYNGLVIENKHGVNRQTPEQVAWLRWLNINGYLAIECRCPNDAVAAVKEYMDRG